MNKRIILVAILIVLVGSAVSCSAKTDIFDTGKPGVIKVQVFLDENRNGKLDQGESGILDIVGISQDISCPAGNMDKITQAETTHNGEIVFGDLQPGVYCIALMSNKVVTTKLAQEIYLSSEQDQLVEIGISEQ